MNRFDDFMQIMYDFNIETTANFLRFFVKIVKSIDKSEPTFDIRP